jgi:hypothetical protein
MRARLAQAVGACWPALAGTDNGSASQAAPTAACTSSELITFGFHHHDVVQMSWDARKFSRRFEP